MSPWAFMKRSSYPSVLLMGGIQRMSFRPLSAAAAGGSSSANEKGDASFSSSSAFGHLSGIVAGSGLGFWLWSSPECSFSSADWNTATVKEVAGDDVHLNSVLCDAPQQERKPKYLFADSYRRRVFFNYEKRIRLRSPPEKVFEYFASFRSPEGEVFMTPADLMRAIIPVFPPSESNIVREGYLRGEKRPGKLHYADPELSMLFDTNNDGLISFPEYIFFVTLLSIPESSFSVAFKMFDLDNNGQGSSHRDGMRIGLKVGTSVENGGLLEYFFGKDGTECLQHEKFVAFLKDLHEEILRLEFVHYDCKLQGTIPAKDFALSMVASADMNHINKFLDRVDELNNDPHLRDIRITLEEFKDFAELRKRLQPLALAIFSYGKVNGLLTKKDFQRAASHVCGISITENVVDVIFHVFDVNRDGNLSVDEFLGVLERRERDMGYPADTGIVGMLSCWWNCAKACSFERVLQ
ncbi:calcium uptake protein, mitochondrial-like isoform X2 [Magnolia sinica]|uniref:calcium uptake protein, mitochondrial-like isoform X2 n=1 Tax=Magnolia sinica TaxID=86752 RepID=UPI002658707F|nr:calcium uptake protein, mitochondrial-like isoform X2 [Magnolia sinica]